MNKSTMPSAFVLACLLAGCAGAPPAPAASDAAPPPPANAFEAAFAAKPDVRPIRWGGWIETLTPGTGASPGVDDKVTVNYRGTLTDGTEFDSSAKHGGPATFSRWSVIPCWTNGLPMMKVGEKARLVCPAAAAYGAAGSPPLVPGGATLVFEIELLSVAK